MTSFSTLVSAAAFAATLVASAPTADAIDGKRRGEQSEAREQFMAGQVKSLREIEGRILPKMRGMQYLGPEYDAGSQVYRLKFLDAGRVIFVDVDARTGAILRQAG
ncbi:PepSY domain-containing protein [Sphingomonas sp. 35-24ZXX]|uniref:PepSY domain-containing protein n=1 Tax=Sphingomonas sp. 35-24ZXX TaxID=1545915 RepID=UPI00053C06C1|nr:PepSY domain-containing protein [Sphingomonas sp. 35-24ZXX]